MKRHIIIALAVAVAIVIGGAWLYAAPSLGSLSVGPSYVTINVPTKITFTIPIADASLLPNSVNILQTDANGKALGIIGTMHDDGLNPDVVAGDGVFSYEFISNQPSAGRVYFRAVASLKGVLRRVTSSVSTVAVWQTVASANSSFVIAVPPESTTTSDTTVRYGRQVDRVIVNQLTNDADVTIFVSALSPAAAPSPETTTSPGDASVLISRSAVQIAGTTGSRVESSTPAGTEITYILTLPNKTLVITGTFAPSGLDAGRTLIDSIVASLHL